MSGEWIRNLPMAAYLADRDRWAGSALSMVDREPESLEAWLDGKSFDRPTEAKARGAWAHALMQGLSPEQAGVVFLPTAAEFCEPAWELTPGGQPRKVKGKRVPRLDYNGAQIMEPQDASPAGERHAMYLKGDYARKWHAQFVADNAGKAIVSPETQRMASSMARAVMRHEQAAALLMPGPGLDIEVTGRWTGEDGLQYQCRPDAARLEENIIIEIKTVALKGEHRLDTLRPRTVLSWAQDGWARKSAMIHDCAEAIKGNDDRPNPVLWWVVVEAREDNPRVSCIPDATDSLMAQVGRDGSPEYDIRGYRELAAVGEFMKRKKVFSARCTRPGEVLGWNFPDYLSKAMGNGKSGKAGDLSHRLKGATKR